MPSLTYIRRAAVPPARTEASRWWRGLGTALLLGITVTGCSKPAPTEPVPTPTPAPAATPTPTPTPSPTPVVEAPKYTGAQQAEYIKSAAAAFIELRGAKLEPYLQARKAFNDAGGINGGGLTSKENIAHQREIIAKTQQANDDYLAFVSTQQETYRAELSKTPLQKEDVDSIVDEYVAKSKPAEVVKLRETERERLKTADEMLAYLDKKFGAWSLKNNKFSFKKPADANGYGELIKKYNGLVAQTTQMQADLNGPMPTPGVSSGPSVSPTTAASPIPAATVVPNP